MKWMDLIILIKSFKWKISKEKFSCGTSIINIQIVLNFIFIKKLCKISYFLFNNS